MEQRTFPRSNPDKTIRSIWDRSIIALHILPWDRATYMQMVYLYEYINDTPQTVVILQSTVSQ